MTDTTAPLALRLHLIEVLGAKGTLPEVIALAQNAIEQANDGAGMSLTIKSSVVVTRTGDIHNAWAIMLGDALDNLKLERFITRPSLTPAQRWVQEKGS